MRSQHDNKKGSKTISMITTDKSMLTQYTCKGKIVKHCQIVSKKPSEEVEQHQEKGHYRALTQPSTAVIGSTPLFIGLHLGHVLPPILERSTTVI